MPTLRLTKQSVAALTLPAGKDSELFFDAEVRGFGLKLSSGGSRRYFVQYRPAGQRQAKRLSIGPASTLTVEEARRQAKAMIADALRGEDPHAVKAAKKAQVILTLGMAVESYLAFCATKQKASTHYQTSLHLKKHWAALHALPLDKVERKHVAARLTELSASSGGVSANRSRSQLSSLFSWAIAEGLVEINPVSGTRKPKEEKPRDRVLSDAELRSIWHACGDDPYGRIVRLLMLTGQRREEVGDMTDPELDMKAALWTVPAWRTKAKREQITPLSPAAMAILHEAPRRADRDLIFSGGAKGFSAWSGSKKRLDARIRATGQAPFDWTLHDLRRTAATVMADRLGVLPHVVEAVLNHVSGHKAGVAGVYNRATYLTEKRDALNRWADEVERICGRGAD